MDNSAVIWRLIARSLNEELSEEEQQELTEILHQNPSLMQQYDLMCRIWKEKHGHPEYAANEVVGRNVSRIITKAELQNENSATSTSARSTRINRRRAWLAAVSVLMLASAGWLGFSGLTNSSEDGPKSEAIEAKKGSRSRSLLPDGTTVWLNAGSKISYEGDFTGATREVKLEGEAFFDVVKQPGRPFIVHTAGIEIKVLGTAFNVKSYPEDKTIETTLYRGAVKVFREKEAEANAIQLKPNEKLIIAKEAALSAPALSREIKTSAVNELPASFTIAKIDSTKSENERIETAWLYSRLEFRGDNFEELAKKLERWYNVSIMFADDRVKQLSFNGSFEGETVEQAFAFLKEANAFNYKIKGHEINVGSVQ